MTKAQIKNLLLYLIIVVIILLITLFFWYFFKTTKKEKEEPERTLEDILREDLTAPAGEIPQVSPETINNLSAPQGSQANKVEEEVIQALTPPQ